MTSNTLEFVNKLPFVPDVHTPLADVDQSQFIKQKDVSLVGIFSCIAYFLTFIYMYYSSSKHVNMFTTLSQHIAHTDRGLFSVLFISFISLYIALMVEKGFLVRNKFDLQTSIIVANVLLVVSLLSMYLNDRAIPNILQLRHYFVATMIIVFIVYNCFVINYVYDKEFQPNDLLNALKTFGILNGVFALCIILLLLYHYITRTKVSVYVGYFELIILLSYGIVLILTSMMPKLYQYIEVCKKQIKE